MKKYFYGYNSKIFCSDILINAKDMLNIHKNNTNTNFNNIINPFIRNDFLRDLYDFTKRIIEN
jgi:hypothetical protein